MTSHSIRNFCIIAHIDHGKSTLADRMLEYTGTIHDREMRDQVLDSMELERERGITIKLQPVRMLWRDYVFNLIDTPGHIDFNYEVSRSLAAVEGAVLLVDATQGVEAQTLSNVYMALEQNLIIIPVINKIDLPAADVTRVRQNIMKLLGCAESEILLTSAKTGVGVRELLDAIIERVPAPREEAEQTRALIFDAEYNEYKGVIIYVRMYGGAIRAGDHVLFLRSKIGAEVLEVGFMYPQLTPSRELAENAIGYIITNIKDIDHARVGDTITLQGYISQPLPGYREVKPMVFAGIYPAEGSLSDKLRKAIQRLKLNDASLSFTPDHSEVLGFGYRCGFLGLLHLEIFQERLRREYDLDVIVTSPTVAYKVYTNNKTEHVVTSPISFPEDNTIDRIEEPFVTVELVTPKHYMGVLMDYIQSRRGTLTGTEFIDESGLILHYTMPLSNIIVDFYDRIKNLSSGYASYTYEVSGYGAADIAKLEFIIADERMPALTILVHRDEAYTIARRSVNKLKKILPRAQFVIKIQAAIGAKIIASERLSALRKDVTAKLYGGDVTRKRKLLDKQKKGKKRLAQHSRITIPHSAYLTLLKHD